MKHVPAVMHREGLGPSRATVGLLSLRAVATLVWAGLAAAPAAFAQGRSAPIDVGGRLMVPPPSGFVNDFAGVVSPGARAAIERRLERVQAATGGEIAVVTLRDIGGRNVGDVALRIGRGWGVGAAAAIGDRRRNSGVVVLVVPKETSSDGRGHISIQTGQGAEGFIPDAVAGDIRREAISYLQRQDYSGALNAISLRLTQRYAAEFGFALDSADTAPARPPDPQSSPLFTAMLVITVAVVLLTFRGRRHGGLSAFLVGQMLGHALGSRGRIGRYRSYGGFGSGFGGSGSSGGFRGFGGGGGFSGGGSSGSW
ncbi:MAG: TPM domain-containing protein [Gemmatimonadetes bacterium]|nr:TPM domain-containing protein [Gemmatimonadota bacterium]